MMALHLMVSGTAERKCPEECTCMEDHDRFITLCYQGDLRLYEFIFFKKYLI